MRLMTFLCVHSVDILPHYSSATLWVTTIVLESDERSKHLQLARIVCVCLAVNRL